MSGEAAEIQAMHELWNATAPQPPTAEEVLDGLLEALCDLSPRLREQLRREAERLANDYNDPYLVGLNRLIEALDARQEGEEEMERYFKERGEVSWSDLD